MTPERWQQINELYHSSLEREPFERAAFIAQACDGDEELRQEIESLLSSHEQADSFIEQPVVGAVARLLITEQTDSMTGNEIGHYKILTRIGTGGMGEVYLAQDTKLGRQVAIKLLPDRFTLEADRVRRFQQEARSASALNHPNILTIYEIAEVENRPYIATEFIDGQTLRQIISIRSLKLGEALDLAIQIASALQAAHEAGIVHRDIKPENVMVRSRDRIAKVLDFGLAKLTDQPSTKLLTDSDATTVIETSAGMIMGTISYMSPEQARALPVDARTDIFSFGVVLYEMLAGSRPFEGSTQSDVLVAILEKDPAPLSLHWPDVPPEMERIVTKALEKEVKDRYQTIEEMAVDLRKLKQNLETQSAPELSTQLDWNTGALVDEGSSPTTSKAARRGLTRSGKTKTLKTFSVQYLGSEIKEHKTGVMMAAAPLFLIIIAGVFFFRSPKESKPFDSLAIMPFSFASNDPKVMADPDREYLSDGITESLINNLSQLPEMKVIASSSMFRYKGQQTDPQKVGQELQVKAILTGRIVRRGENLTISVELIDTKENSHIWGAQYDRKVSDLVVVQKDISKQITDQLRLKLTGKEQQQLTKRYTENPDAYQLYLKGRYYLNKENREAAIKATEYFQAAINIDQNYALAYTGLADCYSKRGSYGWIPPEEAHVKGKAAATSALKIDNSLAEAHATLASFKIDYEWDWTGAEQECRRALELNVNLASAHSIYSWYLSVVARHDEAIAEGKQALVLDPLSININSGMGYSFYLARRYDQAIEQLRQTIDMDPNFPWAHRNLGLAFEQKKMYTEAINEFKKHIELSKGRSGQMALGHAYAVAGMRDEALKMVAQLKEVSQRNYVAPFRFALIYVGLGENDQAFEWLEKSFKEKGPDMTFLKSDPRFDPLRSDPRFADLLRRMKLDL